MIAQAAKNARIAWAMLQSGESYQRPAPTAAHSASAARLVAVAASAE